MDKIFLHGMRVETLIGVYEWERQTKQQLVFNLKLGLNRLFTQEDNINETVHYGMLCELLRNHVCNQQFLLLEALACESVKFLFQQFSRIEWINLQIIKLGILPNVQEVGVEIERNRSSMIDLD